MKCNNRMKYSMHLSLLKQLKELELINDSEYDVILKKIMKDFGVVSNITA